MAAHEAEQRREFRRNVAGGVFLFGYFLLDKQKKVTSCRATPDLYHQHTRYGVGRKSAHPTKPIRRITLLSSALLSYLTLALA